MTVISSMISQVKPGRFDDAVALTRQVAKVVERHGATNVRYLRSTTGETRGQTVIALEFPSLAAWGAHVEKITADDEITSVIAQAARADGPFLSSSSAVGLEIPLDGIAAGQGNVILTSVSRPLPGRFEDAVDLATRTSAVLQRHGALGSRLIQQGIAGSQSSTLVLAAEFAGTAAMGAALDQFMADATGQELMSELSGASIPHTPLSTDIFSVIAL